MLGVVLAMAALFSWREEASFDLGFQLGAGRYILGQRAWPGLDPFTYTLADRPYVDMSGLFQIAAAAMDGVLGLAGVALLRALLIVATVTLVWVRARERGVASPALLGFGFLLGLAAWEIRFFARPELVTTLSLAAQLWTLDRHRRERRHRWLVAAVAIQLVWIWAHAFALFGIAVLGLYALSSAALGVRRGHVARAPWVALLAGCGTLFLNPYGAQGVAFLWMLRTRIESGNVIAETVSELASPFSPLAQGFRPLVAFKILMVAAGLVVLLRVRRLPLFDVTVAALFGVLAALRVRNIGLFVIAALPVALEAADQVRGAIAAWRARAKPSRADARRAAAPPRAAIATAAFVAIAALVGWQLVGSAYYAANQRPVRFGHAASPAVYPVATVSRLDELGLQGPIYNAIQLGGYLIAQRWPRHRVFADSRGEVMGDAFWAHCTRIESGAGWPEGVARWRPNTALVPYALVELTRRIHADSAWALIDVDAATVLFARRIPEHQAAIDQAATRFARWNAPDSAAALPPPRLPSWLELQFGRRRFPQEAWGRGNALLVLGHYEAARREYRRALEQADVVEPVLVRNYATTCYTLGRRDEARAWFERVVQLEPHNAMARQVLAELSSPR